MVPPEALTNAKLQRLYDALTKVSTDPSPYGGVLSDAAFELLDADSFIAGIASTLLEHRSVDPAHFAAILRPLLCDTVWNLRDGSTVDLRAYPELLRHARLVEDLRDECVKFAKTS